MDTDNQQQQPEDLQNMPPQGSMHQQLVAQQHCNEVVKRKTKRHEYVEVDGFHFRRKRRAPPTPLVNAAAANAAATAAAAGKGAGASPCSNHSPAAVKPSLQLDDAEQPSPAASPAAEQLPARDADTADQGPAVDDAAAAEEQQAAAEDACTAGAADESTCHTPAPACAEPSAASQQAAAAVAEAAAVAQAAAVAAAEAAAAAAAAEAAAAAADLEMVEASEEPESEEPPQQSGSSTQFTMLPAELCHLVSSFLAAELHKLPGFTPTSAQQAADSIRQQLAQQLQQRKEDGVAASQGAGTEGEDVLQAQGEAAGGGNAVPPLTVLPHQLEELKEKLVDKHRKLLQEQEAWVQVLAQYNSMSSAPAADAAQGSAAAAGATPRQELGGSSTQAAGWSAQACATTDATGAETPMPEAAADSAAAAEAAEEGSAGAEVADADGPVCAEQQDSLLGVQLKVEVLTALVAKMEHLVGRAEATARALQANYRAEKFSVFPHVDSPAMLIKSLAGRGSQAIQGGTQRGTQGGKS